MFQGVPLLPHGPARWTTNTSVRPLASAGTMFVASDS